MARLGPANAGSTPTVLVIDDDTRYLRSMTRLLKVAGIEAFGESNPEAAIEIARRLRPEVILVDFYMPTLTGDEVIERVRAFDSLVPCLVISGYAGGRGADLLRNPEVQALYGKADNPTNTVASVRMWAGVHRGLRALHEQGASARPVLDLLTSLFRLPSADRFERAFQRLAATAGVNEPPDGLVVSSDGPVLASTGAYAGAASPSVTGTVGLIATATGEGVTWSSDHLIVTWSGGAALVRAPEPGPEILDALRGYPIAFEALQMGAAQPDRYTDSWGP